MEPQASKGQIQQYPAPLTDPHLPSTDVRMPTPEFEDSADLRDYLDVILRRKWLVLTFLLGVFVTTLVVSLTMTPLFKASGRLELSRQGPKVTKFEDVDIVANQLQTREFIQTQVKLLQSESLARRVIDKLNLARHPLFQVEEGEESLMSRWKGAVKGWLKAALRSDTDTAGMADSEELERLLKQKQMEAWFLENLSVQPERDTTIVSLSFSSEDPAMSRDVINSLVQEFIGWEMDKRIDAASSAKLQLEKQIQVARIQLEKSESDLNQFAKKAGIVSLNSNLNLVYRQLEEINNALAAAQAERIAKEAQYRQAVDKDISTLPRVIDNLLIQTLREKYVVAVSEYEQLHTVFKDDYPRLKNLKAKMDDIQVKIREEERRILSSIENDYKIAQEREASLLQEAERKKARALALNDQATQYKILEREVETNKQIYQSLLERAKEIEANVGTDLSNIRVVDYATLPLTPYKPNIRLNLLLAIVVGLMGGVGIAFFLEYLDNTVKRLDEISDRFQIPVLGVVPEADEEDLKHLDFLVRTKPTSSFSEAIRTSKVSIQLSSFLDQPPKLLLITSTTMGEGKSTIASNLAQAFASNDTRVVLVDCDLRRPRLHKTFCSNGHQRAATNGKLNGVSQLLNGICKFEEAIHKTDVPNLYFMPAGPIPPNPAELLASSRMRQLLDGLATRFDRVILDGPLAAGFADVLALGNYVNGVIIISTLGQTHREALRIFRRSLHNVGGYLMGSIVNRLNISQHYGGYYYKYHKYYHYSYHDKRDHARPELEE